MLSLLKMTCEMFKNISHILMSSNELTLPRNQNRPSKIGIISRGTEYTNIHTKEGIFPYSLHAWNGAIHLRLTSSYTRKCTHEGFLSQVLDTYKMLHAHQSQTKRQILLFLFRPSANGCIRAKAMHQTTRGHEATRWSGERE